MKTLLECLEEHTIELLDILLVECLIIMPLKRLGELNSVDSTTSQLQFGEQFLQLIEDAISLCRVLFLEVGPAVDAVSELRGHEEGLYEAVDVASGGCIRESLITFLQHLNQII